MHDVDSRIHVPQTKLDSAGYVLRFVSSLHMGSSTKLLRTKKHPIELRANLLAEKQVGYGYGREGIEILGY